MNYYNLIGWMSTLIMTMFIIVDAVYNRFNNWWTYIFWSIIIFLSFYLKKHTKTQ